MKIKRLICMLFVCITMTYGSFTPAEAIEAPVSDIVWMEDMEWDWINSSDVFYGEDATMPLTTEAVSTTIPLSSIKSISRISLQNGSIVSFDCSYSPLFASMDFGVITSSGRFYHINVKEGSINQAIGISQAGTYQVAIRNNSSQTVRVVGFVNY